MNENGNQKLSGENRGEGRKSEQGKPITNQHLSQSREGKRGGKAKGRVPTEAIAARKKAYEIRMTNPCCIKCGTALTADNWYGSDQRKHLFTCKPCRYAEAEAWRKNNPDKRRLRDRVYRNQNRDAFNARSRAWRSKNKDKVSLTPSRQPHARHAQKLQKYQLTVERYDMMLSVQHGVCALCGGRDKKRMLAVDHCHVTGKIRGLLCWRCNSMLGVYEQWKSQDRITAMESYLQKGGGTDWDNIQLTCEPCNQNKGDSMPPNVQDQPRAEKEQ